MQSSSRGRSSRFLTFVAGALLILSGIQPLGAQPAPGRESPEEICKACHLESFNTYAGSKHGTRIDLRAPASRGGCIACHGAGAIEHAKKGGGRGVGGIVNPGAKAMAPDAKNSICLNCHQGDPARMHWQASVHAGRDVSCTSCHKVHTAHDEVRDKLTQPQVCFTCHKEQRVQINKPYRHPILEGKVSCADCHNVHGNNPKQMVRGSVVETCYQCHMEKRGPFVHNHQPVTEDCTICHQPHGTTIANLLKSRPPFLCQDCHASSGHPVQFAGPPTGRTTSTSQLGTVGRGCLNCHTNIHGSNSTQNSATAGRFRR
ncbi:MAG: DmsE family decaheme c-type cytochrome [Betaproteobacteria bacterium]